MIMLNEAEKIRYEVQVARKKSTTATKPMPTVNLSNLNIEDNKISGWTIPQ